MNVKKEKKQHLHLSDLSQSLDLRITEQINKKGVVWKLLLKLILLKDSFLHFLHFIFLKVCMFPYSLSALSFYYQFNSVIGNVLVLLSGLSVISQYYFWFYSSGNDNLIV